MSRENLFSENLFHFLKNNSDDGIYFRVMTSMTMTRRTLNRRLHVATCTRVDSLANRDTGILKKLVEHLDPIAIRRGVDFDHLTGEFGVKTPKICPIWAKTPRLGGGTATAIEDPKRAKNPLFWPKSALFRGQKWIFSFWGRRGSFFRKTLLDFAPLQRHSLTRRKLFHPKNGQKTPIFTPISAKKPPFLPRGAEIWRNPSFVPSGGRFRGLPSPHSERYISGDLTSQNSLLALMRGEKIKNMGFFDHFLRVFGEVLTPKTLLRSAIFSQHSLTPRKKRFHFWNQDRPRRRLKILAIEFQ